MASYSESYELQFPRQSSAEETANTVTHAIGLVLSIVGGIVLLTIAADRLDIGQVLGLGIYVAAVITVYLASTMSHAIQQPMWKHRWRVIDQAAIYLMIAGTYTPFILAYLPSDRRWFVFAGVWAFAIAGFVSKAVLKHRVEAVGLISYLMLGWLPAMPMLPFMSLDCLMWMALGGLLYTVGAIFLALDERVPFFHMMWHLFVLLATVCHFYAIVEFVV